jgi:putative PEP-CTERM system TPR-repeat lipoprotein
MKTTLRRSARPATLAAALVAVALLAGCGPDSPEKLMEQARASLAKQDGKAAEIHLKNLLQQKPDDGEARALLAGLHAANRDPRSAEKEWRRALELGIPPDRALPGLLESLMTTGDAKGTLEAAAKYPVTQPEAKAAVAYWSGRAQVQNGQSAQAELSYRAALAAKPDFARAEVGLILLQAARGDIAGASSAIDALLARAPALLEALLLKADLQLATSDAAGARDTLAKAIEADPRGLQARLKMVSLLTDLKDYPAAESQHEALQKLAPGLPMTVYLKAVLDFRQGRLDAARDGAQQVLKIAPDMLPAIALAANVALMQNSTELAEQYARQVMDKAPGSLQGARLMAAVHLRKNDPERALQVARAALDKGAQDPALLGIAGEASLRRNDTAGAAGYFERAARLDPKDASKRTGLGLALLSAGKSEAGFADLEAAAELDRDSAQADLALIMARMRARQFDEALAAIDRLEKKQPDKPLTHNLRGTALLGKNDVPKARASFERALQIDPAFYAAAANLAQLDLRDKKPEDARKRFESVIQKDPKSVQAYLALAELTARSGGGAEEVTRLLKQAQTANPAAIEPVLGLAQQLMQQNKPKDAVPLLQQALAQHPDNAQLLDALGTAFLRSEEKQQAIETFEKLVRLSPKSPQMHLRMGELKASLDDNAGAMASFRQAAELDPKAPGPQFGIAAMLLKDGKKDEAQKIAANLQKALPSSSAGLALEGDLFAADKRWLDAAASYRKAIVIERSTPLVVKQHQSLLRGGKAPDAEAALKDGVRAAPADIALRMYAGEQAVAARQWKGAAEHYDVVVKANPANVVALNNLAWSLKELKDPRALQVAEDAYKRAPKAAPVIDTLAMILVERGDAKRGVELLKQATDLAPKVPDYRLHYAQALAGSGDKAAARGVAEALIAEFPESGQAKVARELAKSL